MKMIKWFNILFEHHIQYVCCVVLTLMKDSGKTKSQARRKVYEEPLTV